MDIYFTDEYGKTCELIEGGICETFAYKSAYGEVRHMFIKRPIPQLIDGKQYFDIITPYGYGGPLILNVEKGYHKTLCYEFGEAFKVFCEENNIISEFVRFHPIMYNAEDFKEIYHPVCIRKTLGTNLANFEDPIQGEFSKSCRKSIRQALRKGIKYRITQAPKNIGSFIDIYYSTMNRDHASDFYYFGKQYFDMIVRLLKEKLLFIEAIFEDKTIAAGLFFLSEGTIHIHLSGTLSEYLYLSPAYILRYAATLWGKENNFKLIHHGGGTSNAPDNPLYLFKKQFAQHTEFDFCIGTKIWDQEIYKKLCMKTNRANEVGFFPAYRKR